MPLVSSPVAWLLPLLGLMLLCALGRLLWGRRAAALALIEALPVYALIGAVALSWIGVLLAVLGWFRPWTLAMAMAMLIGGRWVTSWQQARIETAADGPTPLVAEQRKPRWHTAISWAALGAVLLGAAWLDGRPSESYFVTDDVAVYALGGATLAETGGLWAQPLPFWQEWVPEIIAGGVWNPRAVQADSYWIPYAERVRSFYHVGATGIPSRHYGPFYSWSLNRPEMEIGYLPLPKVWMALCVWLLGTHGVTWAGPLFGVLSLCLLFAWVRALRGVRRALVAAAILALCLPQVWFSRFPVAEIYTQALIGGALLLAGLARRPGFESQSRDLAVLSGICLGTLALVRFEAPVLILALAVPLAVLWWQMAPARRRATMIPWAVGMLATSLLGLLIAFAVARYYLFTASLYALTPGLMRWTVLGTTLGIGLGLLAWRGRTTLRSHASVLVANGPHWLSLAVTVVWAAWALLAAYQIAALPAGESMGGWLQQYWSSAGLALCCAGLLGDTLRRRAMPAEGLTFLLAGGLMLGLFSLTTYATPLHPWAVRRLVPLVFPSFALGGAAAAMLPYEWIAHRSRRFGRLVGGVVGLGVALALVVLVMLPTRSLFLHHDRQGLYTGLDALNAALPADAVVLVEDGPVGKGLTQPLELLYHHPALSLLGDASGRLSDRTDQLVTEVISRARSRDLPTYLLIADGGLRWYPTQWRLESRGAVTLHMSVLPQVWGRPPTAADVYTQTLLLDLYELLPAEPKVDSEAAGCLPIGAGAYATLREGFYPAESAADGTAFRWTDGDAAIALPWPTADRFEIVAQLAGARLEGAAPAELTVLVEGEPLYTATLDPSFSPQSLRLPVDDIANVGAPELELRLVSSTFSPDNGRPLGVMLYCLGVEAAP